MIKKLPCAQISAKMSILKQQSSFHYIKSNQLEQEVAGLPVGYLWPV